MTLPEELNYSDTHEWLRLDGGHATVGLTSHGSAQFGEILRLELAAVGLHAVARQPVGTLHCAGAERAIPRADLRHDCYGEQPVCHLVGVDPYGEGWLSRIRVEAGEEIEHLQSAAQY